MINQPTVGILVLDLETKITDNDFSPWHPENYIVSAHYKWDDDSVRNLLFCHDDKDVSVEEQLEAKMELQGLLDACELVVGHNLKFDLQWLWAAGFKYDGPIWDTMTTEYVLSGGRTTMPSLAKTAIKYGGPVKDDAVKGWFMGGNTANQIPLNILLPYGDADIEATSGIYHMQLEIIRNEEKGVAKTVELTNEFCRVLSHMESDGMHVDVDELDRLEDDYKSQFAELSKGLMRHIANVMGDTPINLNSGEDMSKVVFSRKPRDKRKWAAKYIGQRDGKTFPINRKQSKQEFKDILSKECRLVYKTQAKQCPDCEGAGKIQKYKKDGTPYMRNGEPAPTKCKTCDAKGFLYVETDDIAGMKFTPRDASWIAEAGFSLSKLNVQTLAETAEDNNMDTEAQLFRDYMNRSAIKTYLSNFIEGIKKSTRPNAIMHGNFNQAVTATGRLSSSSPNLQNFPRGGTFPVKKVFTSRWQGGKILDVDFSQLEFRAAGILAQDEQIIADIEAGLDVHRQTASIMHQKAPEDVTKDERTGAKADTFKPLYGGTKGTPRQEAYYAAFLQKYFGVAEYHKRLQEEAIRTKRITLPTGRFYTFPFVTRTQWGGASQATKIKNYPVQGFATADIVPWAVIKLYDALVDRESLLINTVHDSIIIDVHPDEVQKVPTIVHEVLSNFTQFVEQFYELDLSSVPLDFEMSMGDTWLDQQSIYEGGQWVNT